MADKLLVAVAYISMSIAGIIHPWFAVIVIAKDVFVSLSGSGIFYFAVGKTNLTPSWGKRATFVE